jgi:hypothetical protein
MQHYGHKAIDVRDTDLRGGKDFQYLEVNVLSFFHSTNLPYSIFHVQ